MADAGAPTIIIKRIKKHAHGHHGGSWKVAYADFVTAMMAFFMLLWLLGNTTENQRQAIQGYFQDPMGVPGGGGTSAQIIDLGGSVAQTGAIIGEMQPAEIAPNESDVEAMMAQIEQERLDALLDSLEYAIGENESLNRFKDQLVLDFTEEGLRIQLIDKDERPMFDVGSDQLKPYSEEVLRALVKVLDDVPNRISISGHTDQRPYSDDAGYTNWELSADRANAARRALLANGLGEERVGRVVGLASSVPFDAQDPYKPSNRRISIIVLNRDTESALFGQSVGQPRAPDQAAVQVLSEKGVKSVDRS